MCHFLCLCVCGVVSHHHHHPEREREKSSHVYLERRLSCTHWEVVGAHTHTQQQKSVVEKNHTHHVRSLSFSCGISLFRLKVSPLRQSLDKRTYNNIHANIMVWYVFLQMLSISLSLSLSLSFQDLYVLIE